MTGRQRVGAELAGRTQQIAELDPLVTAHAGDRRLATKVSVREIVDHALAEQRFVIQHVMRNAEGRGDVPRVVDVLPGAAGALAAGRRAMVVELQGDADDIVRSEERRGGKECGSTGRSRWWPYN